jgi:Putative transposase
MSKALSIVYRTIGMYLIHAAGHSQATANTGAITFILRFGSALNLNIHFHMLFLDGVYVINKSGKLSFKPAKACSLKRMTAATSRSTPSTTALCITCTARA